MIKLNSFTSLILDPNEKLDFTNENNVLINREEVSLRISCHNFCDYQENVPLEIVIASYLERRGNSVFSDLSVLW